MRRAPRIGQAVPTLADFISRLEDLSWPCWMMGAKQGLSIPR